MAAVNEGIDEDDDAAVVTDPYLARPASDSELGFRLLPAEASRRRLRQKTYFLGPLAKKGKMPTTTSAGAEQAVPNPA